MPVTDPRDLYGLPLDRFVPERGALAKTLRGAGNTEEAARVASLRKPSVAAWTVNQLIRTQRRAVADLFAAGDELQRAQAQILAGRGDAGALREAARRERRAADELTEVAGGLLSSDGQEPTRTTLDRVAETLHAAALDEEARAGVQEACLERELRWVGFGASETGAAPAPGRAGRARPARAKASRERAERDRTEREQTEREALAREEHEREEAARARAERLKAARTAEQSARRLAERTARQHEAAQTRRDRAAAALREAEDALATAREEADEAASAHGRARHALKEL